MVSPDGRWVASNGRTRAVVWEVDKLKARYVRPHPKSPNNGPIAVAPTSDRLAVGHGTKIDLWGIHDPRAGPGIERAQVTGVGARTSRPTAAPSEPPPATGTVRSWDAATGTLRHTYNWGLGKLYTAAFAPDGLVGAAGTADGQIVLWDLEE